MVARKYHRRPDRAGRREFAVVAHDLAFADQAQDANMPQPFGERPRLQPAPVPAASLSRADEQQNRDDRSELEPDEHRPVQAFVRRALQRDDRGERADENRDDREQIAQDIGAAIDMRVRVATWSAA